MGRGIILLLSVLLVGCNTRPLPPVLNDEFVFRYHIRTESQVTELARVKGLHGQKKGLAIWDNGVCDVYMPEPRGVWDTHVIGEEITHCIYGKTHD